jgi:hypothetical protein
MIDDGYRFYSQSQDISTAAVEVLPHPLFGRHQEGLRLAG